jgi:hypothetical protein
VLQQLQQLLLPLLPPHFPWVLAASHLAFFGCQGSQGCCCSCCGGHWLAALLLAADAG